MEELRANDPKRTTWIEVKEGSDFPIQNIPFGIASIKGGDDVVVSRIGDAVISLAALADRGFLDAVGIEREAFKSSFLNSIMTNKADVRSLRNLISDLFEESNEILRDDFDSLKACLANIVDCELKMPIKVGDYTDFYSSRDHATNVGKMFRDPENALLPNWLHIPVGYHGRASSIVGSGVELHRPKGQQKPPEGPPVFGPCKRLDFELEMAFVTFDGEALGESISTAEAENYIFGMCIFNDWSARDIQKWEYVPLGPFLSKNFGSSISPWIVTLEALEPFRIPGPIQDPEVLPYLQYEGNKHFEIGLEVYLQPEGGEENLICQSNYKHMYWNMSQQLAHHTVNGCDIRCGDMMASGTISGPEESSFGSMLELSWGGSKSIELSDGSERKFIEDNDTVIMRAGTEKNGVRIGFGEVRTKILPAK